MTVTAFSLKLVIMPHFRRRHALSIFENHLKYSPLVGVFGHRQVGKTSFVSHEIKNYITFDDEDQVLLANQSAKQFVARHGNQKFVFDECQMCPGLFPALKEWVRNNPKPGQFVLTGSVRFSSRKAIRESLTGRIVSLELYPLTLTELLERPLPETFLRLIKLDSFDHSVYETVHKPTVLEQNNWLKYLELGGLPRLAFTRDPKHRIDLLDSILKLILDRDLRMVTDTNLSLDTLLRFLKHIATQAWEPLNFAETKRLLGLNEATQKKLISGLESIFLIRRLSIHSRKTATFLLEDQLEEVLLGGGGLSLSRQIYGALYRNLRAQFGYRSGILFDSFSYRLRSGAWVPLAFRSGQNEIGIIAIEDDEPTVGQRRSADRFLRNFPRGKIVFVKPEITAPLVIEPRIMICAAASLVI